MISKNQSQEEHLTNDFVGKLCKKALSCVIFERI